MRSLGKACVIVLHILSLPLWPIGFIAFVCFGALDGGWIKARELMEEMVE